jgi:hypothetical protein
MLASHDSFCFLTQMKVTHMSHLKVLVPGAGRKLNKLDFLVQLLIRLDEILFGTKNENIGYGQL